MPFKIRGTRAQGRKAAKNPRNPKIDAFQESWDMNPMMKGSKKPEKSKKRCLSRFVGQEPPDQRQQKAQEIQKNDAFQELLDKSPRTKGSKKPEKSKNRCLSRFMGQEP